MGAGVSANLVETPARPAVAFGPFTYDPGSRLLWKSGVDVPLPPRASGVLDLLLARPGQLVAKQDLIATVWRDAFVTETSLAEAISWLRQALGDDPQHPTYIQTLHRRGYRFIADVQDLPEEAGSHTLPRDDESQSVDGSSFHLQAEEKAEHGPRLTLLIPWTIAVFATLIAAVAVWKFTHATAPPARQPARFTIELPPGTTLSADGAPVAVSRDGRVIATSACRAAGDCAIYLRPLAGPDATLVAGTAGAASPFFSPDGRWLGYFANGTLQKIALAGGSPVVLAEAPAPFGAAWLRSGRIVFAASPAGGLSVVPENGGSAASLTRADEGTGHRWPDALPDDTAVVFTVAGGAANQEQTHAGVVSMRTRVWGRLLDGVSAVRAPLPGYLLAQRGRDLVGVAFDPRSLSVTALPASVAPGALARAPLFTPLFTMAPGGTLITSADAASPALQVVLDWDGELRRLVPAPQVAMPR